MSSMSKRAQARTERELHDLLSVPGNSTCADCGARNPAWASWSLGIFLCMRCATIHRKLGTHISKVKSLSMDTWTNEQVDSMKANGNVAVNKIYNPTNKRPDMPLDADEVDNAMERFIRKKYQEKSLASGRPPVPSRDIPAPMRSKSPDASPPPTIPSKKGKFFGFGLRASSSAYPFSKHDKKHRNEPRVDSAFRIASEEYTSTPRKSSPPTQLAEEHLEAKLAQLRDMGFTDDYLNTKMLRKSNGSVERTIEALVRLGPSEKPPSKPTPSASDATRTTAFPLDSQSSVPPSAGTSNNPFDQLDSPPTQTGFGLSFNNSQPQPPAVNTNPWQNASPAQASTGLESAFAGMQVQQPLFPHSTGGYTPQMQQDTRYQQTMTPPVPSVPHWSNNASPISSNNPYMQTPLSTQSTGSNPFVAHMQSMPSFAPSANPFYAGQMSVGSQQTSPSSLANPFGLPPSNSPPQHQSQPGMMLSHPSIFDGPPRANQQYFQQEQVNQSFQSPMSAISPVTSSPGFPNFQYGQPQNQVLQQQQSPAMNQPSYNNPYQQQQQQQAQTLAPQQTGRYGKNDILALFNHPQFAPQKPLASIPEPADDQNQSQQQSSFMGQSQQQAQPPQQQAQYQSGQQQISPVPSGNIYAHQTNNLMSAKRSATMPVTSSPHLQGSRNPFLQNNSSVSSSVASTPGLPQFSPNPYHAPPQSQSSFGYTGGARHASADSVSVNNPNLMDGRHSPDAFANLSARAIR